MLNRRLATLSVNSLVGKAARLFVLSSVVTLLTACLRQETKTESGVHPVSTGGDSSVAQMPPAKSFLIVNEDSPGTAVDVQPYLVAGKTTVVGYISSKSPVDQQYIKWLKQLVQKRKDLVVRLVDINRPGVEEVDFKSPAAYQIKPGESVRVPYFRIYDSAQKLEKDDAIVEVRGWIDKPGNTRRETE